MLVSLFLLPLRFTPPTAFSLSFNSYFSLNFHLAFFSIFLYFLYSFFCGIFWCFCKLHLPVSKAHNLVSVCISLSRSLSFPLLLSFSTPLAWRFVFVLCFWHVICCLHSQIASFSSFFYSIFHALFEFSPLSVTPDISSIYHDIPPPAFPNLIFTYNADLLLACPLALPIDQ